MARNPLIHPESPIDGKCLMQLKTLLESRPDSGEVRDLDLAMLMNVPVNRLSQLKRSRSSIYALGKQIDGEQDGVEDVPSLRPSQAILTRLLLRHPEFAPLPLRPTNSDVFELLAPFIPSEKQTGGSVLKSRKLGFAPLFGRSYISSYKMLTDMSEGTQNSSLPVVRLQMLIVGKYAEIFKTLLREFLKDPTKTVHSLDQDLKEAGWALLRNRDSFTDWMDEDVFQSFNTELHRRFDQWFSKDYFGVLTDEAVSRDIEPEIAIFKGKWVNREAVQDISRYSRNTAPILGREDSPFSLFRESFGLTSAESYWTLGIQIKAFYRFRQRADQRVDPATSILLRYLFRFPNDIDFFVKSPPEGRWILEMVQREDPSFKLSQLAPLFGASRVMSYGFVDGSVQCPFFARRLATIFAEQYEKGLPIYHELLSCVEEEVVARRLDPAQFWRDGRWHH